MLVITVNTARISRVSRTIRAHNSTLCFVDRDSDISKTDITLAPCANILGISVEVSCGHITTQWMVLRSRELNQFRDTEAGPRFCLLSGQFRGDVRDVRGFVGRDGRRVRPHRRHTRGPRRYRRVRPHRLRMTAHIRVRIPMKRGRDLGHHLLSLELAYHGLRNTLVAVLEVLKIKLIEPIFLCLIKPITVFVTTLPLRFSSRILSLSSSMSSL